MPGAIGALIWDLFLERVCRHYSVSGGVVRRALGPRPTDVFLDIGGGTGGVSAPLAAEVGAVVVVEPDAALAGRGHARFPAVRFVLGVGERLPLRDASVDAVLLVEVLHHVPDEIALLREATRVLRPQGRLLIEEFEFDGLRRIAYWFERAISGGVWPRTREGLRRDLAALGYEAEVLEHEGFVVLARRAGNGSDTASGP